MTYGENYIEWQTSKQGMSLRDFGDYLRKKEGSFHLYDIDCKVLCDICVCRRAQCGNPVLWEAD